MKVDLTQQDLVCLVLGSKPKELKDAEYLRRTGYMKTEGGQFGFPDYVWKREAIVGLSDIALYGLFNIIKKGNIEEHYQKFNDALKQRK